MGANSGNLLFVLAAALVVLFIAQTVILAYIQLFEDGQAPPVAKLWCWIEVVKLAIASCLFLAEKRQRSAHTSLARHDKQPNHLWGAFSFAAFFYFISNNLALQAVQFVTPHTYALLKDPLGAMATGVLAYVTLHKHSINHKAVISLAVLSVGSCVGHLATLTGTIATSGSTLPWLSGAMLMVLASLLSAAASVYTEGVMNHSPQHQHESLNLQGMRLYAFGALFNGLFCKISSPGSLVSLEDVRPLHLMFVLAAALTGLITAWVIKRFGNIVKVFTSGIAGLFAAGTSCTLLRQQPAPYFYLGLGLALYAALHQQQATADAEDEVLSFKCLQHSTDHGQHPAEVHPPSWQLKAIATYAVTALLITLFLLTQTGSHSVHRHGQQPLMPSPASRLQAAGEQATPVPSAASGTPEKSTRSDLHTANATGVLPSEPQAAQASPAQGLGPTTDAPMMVPMVPYEPMCFAHTKHMAKLGCPVIKCARDASCTVRNISCCAYFNNEILRFFDRFMSQKCMDSTYLVVYGTALGAIRDQTILPHTEDLDLGLTPQGLQFLEQNETRAELWQHGYVLYYYEHGGFWKVCPHHAHPLPQFRDAMLLGEDMLPWEERTGMKVAAYIDLWLMWRVPDNTTSCTSPASALNLTEALVVPWDAEPFNTNMCQAPSTTNKDTLSGSKLMHTGNVTFCLHLGPKPHRVELGSRTARIHNQSYPTFYNVDEVMVSLYGKDWRQPKPSNHGPWITLPDEEAVRQALIEKLSVTAWGDMPLKTRKATCKANLTAARAAVAQVSS